MGAAMGQLYGVPLWGGSMGRLYGEPPRNPGAGGQRPRGWGAARGGRTANDANNPSNAGSLRPAGLQFQPGSRRQALDPGTPPGSDPVNGAPSPVPTLLTVLQSRFRSY